MASLKNVRHEKFAQCVASGLSGSDAYRQAAEYSGRQADGNAANWMKRPGVRERIEELKTESSARCSLSREAYIKSLVEMYEAKPSEASMTNPRCDVVVVRGQKQAVFPFQTAGRPATGQAGQLGRFDQGRARDRREFGQLPRGYPKSWKWHSECLG
jgi:Terminase small subunit